MMRQVFAGTTSLVKASPALVGASLLANRGAEKSFASKLAPTVGEDALLRWCGSQYPLALLVGASLLANRGTARSFASKLASTVEVPVGSRLPR